MKRQKEVLRKMKGKRESMNTERSENCFENPAVSVIVPVYRPGEGFERCLASLRGQTLENIEMIFVDDLGGDDTMAYLESAAQEDKRIRIIRNEVNSGPGVSRNRGIEAACGEYLAFSDADDYLSPDFLERLYGRACETGMKIVRGEVLRVYEDGRECPDQGNNRSVRQFEKELKEGRALYALFTSSHVSAIYQRRWIVEDGVRYGESRNGEDSTFLLRACHGAAEISCVGGVYYYYVQRKGSLVHTITPERLRYQEMSLKDQVDYILERIPEPDIRYVHGKILYPIQLAQAARLSGYAEDAEASEQEICRQMDRLPCREQLMKEYALLRALGEFGINLAEAALQMPDDEGRGKKLLDTVSRIAAFACMYPDRRDIYNNPFKKSIRKATGFEAALRHKGSPMLKTYRKQLLQTLLYMPGEKRGFPDAVRRKLIRKALRIRREPYVQWFRRALMKVHPIRKAGAAVKDMLHALEEK